MEQTEGSQVTTLHTPEGSRRRGAAGFVRSLIDNARYFFFDSPTARESSFDYDLYDPEPQPPHAQSAIDAIAAMTFEQPKEPPLKPKSFKESDDPAKKWDPFNTKGILMDKLREKSDAYFLEQSRGPQIPNRTPAKDGGAEYRSYTNELSEARSNAERRNIPTETGTTVDRPLLPEATTETGRAFQEAIENAQDGLSPNPTESAERTIAAQEEAKAANRSGNTPSVSTETGTNIPEKMPDQLSQEQIVAEWKEKRSLPTEAELDFFRSEETPIQERLVPGNLPLEDEALGRVDPREQQQAQGREIARRAARELEAINEREQVRIEADEERRRIEERNEAVRRADAAIIAGERTVDEDRDPNNRGYDVEREIAEGEAHRQAFIAEQQARRDAEETVRNQIPTRLQPGNQRLDDELLGRISPEEQEDAQNRESYRRDAVSLQQAISEAKAEAKRAEEAEKEAKRIVAIYQADQDLINGRSPSPTDTNRGYDVEAEIRENNRIRRESELNQLRAENAESAREVEQWRAREQENVHEQQERRAMRDANEDTKDEAEHQNRRLSNQENLPQNEPNIPEIPAQLEQLQQKTERKLFGLPIPPSREHMSEALNKVRSSTNNAFSIGFIGGFGTRLALRAFGMGDIALENAISVASGTTLGAGTELLAQINEQNKKYQQKITDERYDYYAEALFAKNQGQEWNYRPSVINSGADTLSVEQREFVNRKIAEINNAPDENARRTIIEQSLREKGFSTPPADLVNKYLRELDVSTPEKRQERIKEMKLNLLERAKHSGFELNRTINSVMLALGGAVLGSHLAGIGESNGALQMDQPSETPVAAEVQSSIPEQSMPDNVIQAPVPEHTPPNQAIPEIANQMPTPESAAPQPAVTQETIPEQSNLPTPETVPSVETTSPIDWDQTITVEPGSNFWNSIKLDSLEDWTREGGLESKSEVIKDAIAKFAEANGKSLRTIQPGPLHLNEYLSDEQKKLITEITNVQSAEDYLSSGLRDRLQDMLNQTRTATARGRF